MKSPFPRLFWVFVTLGMIVSPTVFPIQVILLGRQQKVVLSTPDKTHGWKLKDSVCVHRGDRAIVCGRVVLANRAGIVVKLESERSKIMRGDQVRLVSGSRQPASTGELLTVSRITERSGESDLSVGLNAGTKFFYPILHFQYAFSQHFAAGIQPLFFSGESENATLTGYGALLTLDYYIKRSFAGPFLELGAGVTAMGASSATFGDEKTTSPTVSFFGGWRGRWDFGLNIGVGIGLEYIGDPKFQAVDVLFSGLNVGVIKIDIGIVF